MNPQRPPEPALPFTPDAPPLDPIRWNTRTYDGPMLTYARHGCYSILFDKRRDKWDAFVQPQDRHHPDHPGRPFPVLIVSVEQMDHAIRACRIHWRAIGGIAGSLDERTVFSAAPLYGEELAPANPDPDDLSPPQAAE